MGRQASDTSVTWTGVPLVAPGSSATRILRITNLRGNATTVPIGGPRSVGKVTATVSGSLAVTDSTMVVGFAASSFSFTTNYASPSTANLVFGEAHPIYRTRTPPDNPANPLELFRQDVTGYFYGTESQFTPCFPSGVAPRRHQGKISVWPTRELC